MRKFLIGFLVLLCLALIFIFFIPKANHTQSSKLKVATTIFPLYDITKNIAGDNVIVVNVLPAGASPHTFSPKPLQIKQISGARVIFLVGHIDEWATQIAEALGDAEIYAVDKNIKLMPLKYHHEHHQDKHEHEEHKHEEYEMDPHYWLSLANARIIAKNITQKLASLDPDHKNIYFNNLESYLLKIDQTQKKASEMLKNISNRKMIVFHESWNYFARDFNLEIVGVFTPAPGREPDPAYLKALYDTAQENNIKAVFSEPQLSSESIKPFVEDLGLDLYIIDPLGGSGENTSYLKTILSNAQVIHKALK